MFKFIKELFAIEKTPRRGLFALEWVVLGYMIFHAAHRAFRLHQSGKS
jgi:hypothetical protein